MEDNYLQMAKIKITQVRSRIHCTKRQKLNLDALGLHRMNATVEHEATPQILGMVNQVKHLLKVTEI
jgi:large subunit ribosomal protein L30